MTNAAPAVRIATVSREFGSVIAVSEVSLDIREGELLTLLGPSGCGKTTLLNLIAGFLEPSSGRIEIGGQDVTGLPPYLRDTGMVFQNYALFPHMSVADNIAFGLKMRKVPRREIAGRVEEALEMVKLAGYGGRRVRQLSGGQQQRVALARALVIRPKVLLLDEPLSALDKNLRGEMQVELKQLQAQLGVTTVFVTHDQGEALSLSDRIVVLNQGRIQQIADPIGLYRRPANSFVASFIGEINHLPGRIATSAKAGMVFELANGARLVEATREDLTGLKPGHAHLFVRPEYISPAREGEAENVLEGTVDTHIYQGTHTQMHVAVEGVGGIELRVPGGDVVERYPSGSSVAIRLDLADCVVLPADEPAP